MYSIFSRGLTDTFKLIGVGFGASWRPQFIMNQPVGVCIDHHGRHLFNPSHGHNRCTTTTTTA